MPDGGMGAGYGPLCGRFVARRLPLGLIRGPQARTVRGETGHVPRDETGLGECHVLADAQGRWDTGFRIDPTGMSLYMVSPLDHQALVPNEEN